MLLRLEVSLPAFDGAGLVSIRLRLSTAPGVILSVILAGNVILLPAAAFFMVVATPVAAGLFTGGALVLGEPAAVRKAFCLRL